MYKKVLVLSSSFMGMCDNLSEAFKKCGYDVTLLKRKEPQISLARKMFHRFAGIFIKRIRHFEKEGVKQLSEQVKNFVIHNPDCIIVDYLGINLNIGVLEFLKNNVYIVKIMGDSIHSYPYLEKSIMYYDLVITYESQEVSEIKRFTNNKVILLQSGYDDTIYRPLSGIAKDIDICFVGKLFSKEHSKRRILLERLVKEYPNLNFEIYGIYAKKYQIFRYLKWKIKDKGKYFKNHNISQEEVNRIYNRSKIVLNINSFQTHNDWSSRLVEIIGSGSFCISQYTKKSFNEFNQYCSFFSDYMQLTEIIKQSLNKTKLINGAKYVSEKYSLKRYVFAVEKELNDNEGAK